MQTSPTRLSPKKSSTKSAIAKSRHIAAQHVSARSSKSLQRSILHRFPYESLSHVTSYLDPRSLSALGAVDRFLREYTSEDVVWKLALYANILGIQPEREQDSPRAFLLRRLETTWKAEYITRYSALMKWSKSTTTFTAHNPLMIPVPHIHLLSDGESLFSAPDDFRWVLRTLPATGKVVKGHFQPTLAHQAHPPPDWSPPATGAFASDGRMIKVAWASQTGGVLVKTAPRALDPKAHRTATSVASVLEDNHWGFIHHLAWGSSKTGCEALISAGGDARVKIWNAETCQALWTSEYASDGAPFVLAALDIPSRTAVALTEKGTVVAWSSLPVGPNAMDGEFKTLSGCLPADEAHRRYYKAVSTLSFDHSNSTVRAIVHAYEDSHASLFSFDFTNGVVDISSIEGPLGAITTLHLDAGNSTEKSTLIVGDALSHVYVYNLDQQPVGNVLKPNLNFAAAEIGSITAITSNRTFIVTGTSLGVITVWDAVTLDQVRSILAMDLVKAGAGVLTILLQAEQLVASVGRSVVHWKTGLIGPRLGKHYKSGKAGTFKTNTRLVDKYYRSIQESQAELEWESRLPSKPATVYSEHEQKLALEALGIDEYGAVEYALMVSHEEALRAAEGRRVIDEMPKQMNTEANVAMTTTDSITMDAMGSEPTVSIDAWGTPRALYPAAFGAGSPRDEIPLDENVNVDRQSSPPSSLVGHPTSASSPDSVASERTGSTPSERVDYVPSSPWKTVSLSKASPPGSVGKVQVSPQYRPEAMHVGGLGLSSSTSSSSSPVHLDSNNNSTWRGLIARGGDTGASSSVQSDREEEDFPSITASSISSTRTVSRKSSRLLASTPDATTPYPPSGDKTWKTSASRRVTGAPTTMMGDVTDLTKSGITTTSTSRVQKETEKTITVRAPLKWSSIVKSGHANNTTPSSTLSVAPKSNNSSNAWTARDHNAVASGLLNQHPLPPAPPGRGTSTNRTPHGYMSEEDAQLQFALELSLAEAMSRQT